jgi:hypothetical protein
MGERLKMQKELNAARDRQGAVTKSRTSLLRHIQVGNAG